MCEDKWLLPSDKGQGKINVSIIIYPKQKKSAGKISDNYKKRNKRDRLKFSLKPSW